MRVTGEDRKLVYEVIESVYQIKVGFRWKWKRGEKTRVMQIFTKMCEAFKERDPENLSKMLLHFFDYVENETNAWLKWQKKDRLNYLGFLDNTEKIQIYAQGERQDADDLDIAGTTNDHWEF